MSETETRAISAEIESRLRAWRTRALDLILVLVLVVSLPAMITSVGNALRSPEVLPVVWVYPLVYLVAAGLAVMRGANVRVRGWGLLLLAYTNAVASFARLGLAGSGRLYILWAPVAAVILLGARAGYITTALGLAIYACFTWLAQAGTLAIWLDVVTNPVTLSFWVEAGLALAMLLILITVLIERFYRLGVTTLVAEREASAALARANERLAAYSQTLEEKVAQRTAELAEAMETAEAATRAKSEFLAKMSHELRTPLNAILGFAQLMDSDANLTPGQQENLAIINRSGEYLLALINDVLDMSKIEAGRLTLETESFDLYGLLDDLENLFKLRAMDKGLRLAFERGPDVPRYIRTDEGKLRQVLINLLSNGVKFTHAGGVKLRVRRSSGKSVLASLAELNADVDDNDVYLEFEIEDTGAGIAAEDLELVFEPFVQTESGATSREGTGLGLPISRQFVRLMGGEIAARSQPGVGSTFSFQIPVEVAAAVDARSSDQPVRPIALRPDQPAYRLLVAEDNRANRQLLVKLLSPLGFQVREAANGQEAVAIWEEWRPHLIWMDMAMPVMDGYAATEHIRSEPGGDETVIVALTASVFESDRDRVLAAGCDDYIRKPFRERQIFDALADYLGAKFVYADEPARASAPAPDGAGDGLTPDALAALPAEWLADLRDATVRAHLKDMLAAIERIRAQDAGTAEHLAELARRFEYRQIMALIDAIGVKA